MTYYAQFYCYVLLPTGQWGYVEPCGDRQIIRIDGRHSMQTMMHIAEDECRSRKYDGYRIGRGERLEEMSFLTSAVLSVLPREVSANG
jgi:hypothetical protein